MAINPEILHQMKMEHSAAPFGLQTAVLKKWAQRLQRDGKPVPLQTLYRELDLGKRSRASKPENPIWREWAKVIAAIKRRPPEEAGEITTVQARKIATSGDKPVLPPEAASVSVGTYDRIMRELGYSRRSIRANRFQAKEPNQAHHIDASSSAFFYVHRQMPDGEYILRLHRPAQHYKNKPTPCDRLRWWYYGMTDDHSGVKYSKGVPAMGENGGDGMEFCVWAWEKLGVPKKLLGDEGALKKGITSSGFIEKCGVPFPPMTPYEKRAHGKIEITWRRMWQSFELQFFAANDWQKFEITGSELNRRLLIFNEEENERKHRFERKITRMDAWRRVMLNGGLVKLPDDVLAIAAHCHRRKVDICGNFSIPGWPLMEVLGLHDAWVFVYESVFENKLVVKEISTGNVYAVRPFKPLDENEFRGHVQTPHQLARKEALELDIDPSALLFQERATEATNIVRMPIREVERPVENVFDEVENYAHVDDALAEVHSIVGPMSDEERAAVTEAVIENNLNKQFVRELAMEMRGEVEKLRAKAL